MKRKVAYAAFFLFVFNKGDEVLDSMTGKGV